MAKRDKLYEGKAKTIFATDDAHQLIQYFKDDATAYNARNMK
jgi:phosphoribosylaminoimidazole-succinocarboxamide synthase